MHLPYAGPCVAPSDAAARVGRRRSASFSGASEPAQGFSGGPSYGWGDGGSGYTTGAAAAAVASGIRKQLCNRPAPGEAKHVVRTRWDRRVYTLLWM